MRVSFSHNFFVNGGEIANEVFDFFIFDREKVVKPKEKKLKNRGRGQPSFLSPAVHDPSISSSLLELLVSLSLL